MNQIPGELASLARRTEATIQQQMCVPAHLLVERKESHPMTHELLRKMAEPRLLLTLIARASLDQLAAISDPLRASRAEVKAAE